MHQEYNFEIHRTEADHACKSRSFKTRSTGALTENQDPPTFPWDTWQPECRSQKTEHANSLQPLADSRRQDQKKTLLKFLKQTRSRKTNRCQAVELYRNKRTTKNYNKAYQQKGSSHDIPCTGEGEIDTRSSTADISVLCVTSRSISETNTVNKR